MPRPGSDWTRTRSAYAFSHPPRAARSRAPQSPRQASDEPPEPTRPTKPTRPKGTYPSLHLHNDTTSTAFARRAPSALSEAPGKLYFFLQVFVDRSFLLILHGNQPANTLAMQLPHHLRDHRDPLSEQHIHLATCCLHIL